MYSHVLMRDEKEGREKQARSNKQTRQSNTAVAIYTCIYNCIYTCTIYIQSMCTCMLVHDDRSCLLFVL